MKHLNFFSPHPVCVPKGQSRYVSHFSRRLFASVNITFYLCDEISSSNLNFQDHKWKMFLEVDADDSALTCIKVFV